MPSEPIKRVVIVDDHPASRDGLALRISVEPDLEVCGQAGDVAEALEVIQATQPHLAIIDISLKTGSGIDLIKKIKARNEMVRILAWSMYDDHLYAERALRAGALGYVNKENVTDVVLTALRRILEGKIFLSEETSERLLHRLSHNQEQSHLSPMDHLSDRELEVFGHIGRGKSTAEIAQHMHLSQKTVETYRTRIKEKLNIPSAAALLQQATQWVIENG